MDRIRANPIELLASTAGIALALLLGALLLGGQLVSAAPNGPDFTVTPAAPVAGQPVTFTATGLKPTDSVRWDFDNDGRFDATGTTVQHVYPSSGQRTVLMRVTRPGGEGLEVLKSVSVSAQPPPPAPNQVPVAALAVSPNPAVVGQAVEFSGGSSSDPDGTIAAYAWDLDDDGQFDDAAGVTASRSFGAAGSYTVRLRVTDNRGSTDVTSSVVTVNAAPPAAPAPNQAPVASFTFSPALPVAGSVIRLTSNSSDSEGPIAGHAWDLDDDGRFDDFFGAAPLIRFGAPGFYRISLRVVDARGASHVTSRTVPVRAPLAAAAPQLMTPFPVVRIVGRSTRLGARVRLLVVRGAPRGAKVTVRCRGRRCPLRTRSKYVRSGSVRFRSFERRLPAGVRIQIFVLQPGRIGKYTSFKIRRGRSPLRKDLCATTLGSRPAACPAA